MSEKIRILLIEDNPADVDLICETLESTIPSFGDVQVAGCLTAALEALSLAVPDVLLLDLNLPDSSGLETILSVRERFRDGPIVVLTGLESENLAIDAMRTGVQDFVGKSRMNRDMLTRSIRYAVERSRIEQDLQAAKNIWVKTFDATGDGICQIVNYVIRLCNKSFATLFGRRPCELVGKPCTEVFPEGVYRTLEEHAEKVVATGIRESTEILHDRRWFEVVIDGMEKEAGEEKAFLLVLRDITARKDDQRRLQLNEARLESLYLISQFQARNTQELLDFALGEAVKLTASSIGYIYHYDEKTGLFTLNSWSKEVMQECTVVKPQSVYQLEKTGLWGEAVRQRRPIVVNDYEMPNALKKGYPAGHVSLKQFLTVPIFVEKAIVAVVGVANKTEPYDDSDQRQLGLLMDAVWRIVERKASDEKFGQLFRDWEDIFNSITDLVTVHDLDYTIVRANRAAEEFFGRELFQQQGRRKCFLLFHGTENPPEECPSCKCLTTGIAESFEHYEPHLRRHLEVRAIPRFDNQQKLSGILHLVRDITEKKQVEITLKRRLEVEQGLAEISTRFVNPENFDQVMNATLYDLARISGAARCLLYRVRERPEVMEVSHEWHAPGLEPVKIRHQHAPLFEMKDNLPIGGTWVTFPLFVSGRMRGALELEKSDSTNAWHEPELNLFRISAEIIGRALERELTAQALQKSEQQLRQAQKMEAVGQLSGGVAHDFNNMLQVISCYTYSILSELPSGRFPHQEVREIELAVEKAAYLVKQLLTFSRQEPVRMVQLNLDQIVSGFSKLLRRVLGEDIELELELDNHLPPINADKGHLEQILMNLCVNARDAMPGGGKIRISTRQEVEADAPSGTSECEHPKRVLVLSVIDSGCGISVENLPRIFEPFFTTKEVGRGTGLGLATVFGIVQQHGAKIDVKSTPGVGTEFSLRFPVVEKEQIQEVAVNAGVAGAMGGNESVLLAEDDHMLRHLMTDFLTRAGYRVSVAENGQEAMDLAKRQKEPVDLYILDVVMPKKRGNVVFEEILRLQPQARFLFVSGYGPGVLDLKGVGEVYDFLAKPVSPAQFLKKVREILDRRRK